MNKISKPVWLSHSDDHYHMQAVSYDNRMHEENPTQCMVDLMNVIRTPLDDTMIKEAKEGGDYAHLATMQDYAWKALTDQQQEMFAGLNIFGEHTRVVIRLFHEVDGRAQAVVVKDKETEHFLFDNNGVTIAPEQA